MVDSLSRLLPRRFFGGREGCIDSLDYILSTVSPTVPSHSSYHLGQTVHYTCSLVCLLARGAFIVSTLSESLRAFRLCKPLLIAFPEPTVAVLASELKEAPLWASGAAADGARAGAGADSGTSGIFEIQGHAAGRA